MPDHDDQRHKQEEGAWGESQRYVFAELRRHGRLLDKLDEKLDLLSIAMALINERDGKIATLEKRVDDLEDKILANQLPRWMVAIAIAVVATAVVPAIRAYFQTKGTP